MRIPDDIIDTLKARAVTSGHQLVLTGDRLDARLYQRIDEILEGAGGRWDTGQQAHIFPRPADDVLTDLYSARTVTTLRERRQQQQYFPTPPQVIDRLLHLAQVSPGHAVLEPSAGRGAIVAALAAHGATVDAIELDPDHAAALTDLGAARTVTVDDFLAVPAEARYDRVVMNPPFTRGADIAHVRRAMNWLAPGGRLGAVMSHAVCWQTTADARAFRQLVADHGGSVEAVPAGAFRGAGTDVRTVLVAIPKQPPARPTRIVWPVDTAAPAAAPGALPPPHVIAAEIADDLRRALREINAVARALTPTTAAVPQPGEQLALDTVLEHP